MKPKIWIAIIASMTILLMVGYTGACFWFIHHPIAMPDQLELWYDENGDNFSDDEWLQNNGFTVNDYGFYQSPPLYEEERDFHNTVSIVIYDKYENANHIQTEATVERQFVTGIKDFLYPWNKSYMVDAVYNFYVDGELHLSVFQKSETFDDREEALFNILSYHF